MSTDLVVLLAGCVGCQDTGDFVGVTRFVHLRENDGVVARRLLADNAHLRVDTYLVDLLSPYKHSGVVWDVESQMRMVMLADKVLGAAPQELMEPRGRPLSLLAWLRGQLGLPMVQMVVDALDDVDLPMADLLTPLRAARHVVAPPKSGDMPLELDRPHARIELERMLREGEVWSVVEAVRAHVIGLDAIVAAGVFGASRARLSVDVLPGRVPEEWLSPHTGHGELAFSEDRGGAHKYIVPTGAWWTQLMARRAASRRPEPS